MALKDWDKIRVNSGWLFIGKTDYNTKGRNYQETDLYLYKKGFFRGRESEVIIKINNKNNHEKDEYYSFRTIKEGLAFTTKYMKKH